MAGSESLEEAARRAADFRPSGEFADSKIRFRPIRRRFPWELKVLAPEWRARKTSGSSPARAATRTTFRSRACTMPSSCAAARPRQHQGHRQKSAAEAMPGVIAVLDGKQADRRRHRQHHLRLDDPLQGRLAHEHGRLASALASPRCAMSATPLPSSSPKPGSRRATRPRPSTVELRGTAGRHQSRRSALEADGAPQLHDNAPAT